MSSLAARPQRTRSACRDLAPLRLAAYALAVHLEEALGADLARDADIRASTRSRNEVNALCRVIHVTGRCGPAVVTLADASAAFHDLVTGLRRHHDLDRWCAVIAPPKKRGGWHVHLLTTGGFIDRATLGKVRRGVPSLAQDEKGLDARWARAAGEFYDSRAHRQRPVADLARFGLRVGMGRLTRPTLEYLAGFNLAEALAADVPLRSAVRESSTPAFSPHGRFRDTRLRVERWLQTIPDPDLELLLNAPRLYEPPRREWLSGGGGRPRGLAHRILDRHYELGGSRDDERDPDLLAFWDEPVEPLVVAPPSAPAAPAPTFTAELDALVA